MHFFLSKSSPTLSASKILWSYIWEFNKPPRSSPDLFNYRSLLSHNHSFNHQIHCPSFSSFTVPPALPPSFYPPLSFFISDSLPFPNSHSYPSACLHLFPILSLRFSPSFSHSISWLQEMDSFPIQGVGGLYLLSQTKRSLCESSKNTKKKRKADKNQKPPHIRLSHTNTHFTSAALMQSISLTIKRHKILLYTVNSTHEVQISSIQYTARALQ